jgi:3-deoxy-D-manno-octulosonic acid hydroxylase-like protein
MPVLTVAEPGKRDPDALAHYCERLEAGDILLFPHSPIAFDAQDHEFLLNQQQVGSGYHKNIAYRPSEDRVTGFVETSSESDRQLHEIMREYSQAVVHFLSGFLAPYRQRWDLDYASYRPQAEESRQLAHRKRNDLLHTDAFPTRPTRGNRILRFFNNINPTDTRNWATGGTFGELIREFAVNGPAPQGKISLPQAVNAISRFKQSFGGVKAIHAIAPQLARSPYDAFMMDFHNFLKENATYQKTWNKEHVQFAPGSSWMVYTDTVAHAVLSGQYAMEQTLLVHHDAMVKPEISPLNMLERAVGGKLV